MAIRRFDVGSRRGLERAAAVDLGNLVVIAGPNGSGKSSLLDLLRAQRGQLAEPGTEVMFVGPHRTWRASQLNRVSTYSFPSGGFGDLLQSETLPAFQYAVPNNLHVLGSQPRDSSSADDVQAFVKTSLVRLRDRHQELLAEAFQAQGGQVQHGSVPELFEPFARLVRTLLPHLEWVGVVALDPDNIQCLFQPAGRGDLRFDIDELSSGEKAAIALLLPLVERQATQLVTPTVRADGLVPLTMLFDEPEIHLHPLLQLQVLDYLRKLAKENSAQFILTTHSTTLLDALSDDELWLLSPAALRPDNQLARLTTNQERLEVARTITGSTHLLTRAKPIVFVEGEPERAGVASDARLTTMLLPETRSWALVPGRAKRDVIEAVQRLRQQDLDLPGMPVFGLVDADRDRPPADEHVVVWPVAMIENLLLDPDAIHRALAPFGTTTRASSPAAVSAALQRTVQARVQEEVQLRVRRQLPVGRLELDPGRSTDLDQVAREQAGAWLDKLRALDLAELAATARTEVEEILAAGTATERFHGKRLLQALYKDLGVQAALTLPGFHQAVAGEATGGQRIERLARPAVQQVRLYFPDGLTAALGTDGGPDQQALARECEEHRTAGETKTPKEEGREGLRGRVFAHARSLPEQQRQQLVSLASEIGTP